jgi:hypothetical protein
MVVNFKARRISRGARKLARTPTLIKKNCLEKTIVIKPGPGVDPAKGPGPEFHGSTRVNTRKNKIKIKVLIFYFEKLKKKYM